MLSKPGKAQYNGGSIRCGLLITISHRIEDELRTRPKALGNSCKSTRQRPCSEARLIRPTERLF